MKKIRINQALDTEAVKITIKGVLSERESLLPDLPGERIRQGKELAAVLLEALPSPTLYAMRKEIKRLLKARA